MSGYYAELFLSEMLDNPAFYLIAVVMLLLFMQKNFWISLSAVGLFFCFNPYFMAVLTLPVVYKEDSLMTKDALVNHLSNGFIAAGILIVAFGFYKLVNDYESRQSRDG